MTGHEMTLTEVRELGLEALRERLGVVGMVRFLQQSETGWGNYTQERHQWLEEPDLNGIAKKIQAHADHPKDPA